MKQTASTPVRKVLPENLKSLMRALVAPGLALCFAVGASAADLTFSETLSLPECHSIGWVRSQTVPQREAGRWDGKLDEAKWGTPASEQAVVRNWSWKLEDAQWRSLVAEKGEGKREDATFEGWVPEGVDVVKGVVAISGHGSGTALFVNPELRQIARELHLALFKFIGNPVQRGFWPRSLLLERLKAMGEKCGHPELEHAPLFLYGHSNGTGFSAVYTAGATERVWGWVSMRPGITFQVYQPAAAKVPGLVIFGEEDHFLGRPSKAENLAVVEVMRKQHGALWNFAVEPKTGHGPGANTWPLVFSFLKHSFALRVPREGDARRGPVALNPLEFEKGYLGENWDLAKGGYQDLPVAPVAGFKGNPSVASWLLNGEYAADWRKFQAEGRLR